MRTPNKHANPKSSRDSSLLRAIRLSDGTFAGRIAGKHVWTVGGTAQRGTMVHRMAPKARRSAAALPIHIDLHVRHLQPVLQLQIRQLQRLHTVEQHIRRIDRVVTRVVERIVPSPSLPIAATPPAAELRETVRERVMIEVHRAQQSLPERRVGVTARQLPVPDTEGERQHIEIRWIGKNVLIEQRFTDNRSGAVRRFAIDNRNYNNDRLTIVHRQQHTDNRQYANNTNYANNIRNVNGMSYTNNMHNMRNTHNTISTHNASSTQHTSYRNYVNNRSLSNIQQAWSSLYDAYNRHFKIDRHYESTINHVHNRNSADIPYNRDNTIRDYPILPTSSLRTLPQQAAVHTVRLLQETRLLQQFTGERQHERAADRFETASRMIGGQDRPVSDIPSIVIVTSNSMIIPQAVQAESHGSIGTSADAAPQPAAFVQGAALARSMATLHPVLRQHRPKGIDKLKHTHELRIRDAADVQGNARIASMNRAAEIHRGQEQRSARETKQSQLERVELAQPAQGAAKANVHYLVTLPARTGHPIASAGAMLQAAQTVLTENRSMTAHIYQAHTQLTEIQRITNHSVQNRMRQTPLSSQATLHNVRRRTQQQVTEQTYRTVQQVQQQVTERTDRTVQQVQQQVTEQTNRTVQQVQQQVTEQPNRTVQQVQQQGTEQTNRTVQQVQQQVTEQTNRTVQQAQHVTEQTNRTVQHTQHVIRHNRLTIQSHQDMQQISITVRRMNLITQQNRHFILRSTLARGNRAVIEAANARTPRTEPDELTPARAQAERQEAIRATRTSMLHSPTMANPPARRASVPEPARARIANVQQQAERLTAPQQHVHRPAHSAVPERVQQEQLAIRNTVLVANRRIISQVVHETAAHTVRQVRREIVRQEHATVHAVQRTIQAEVLRAAAPIGSNSLRQIRVSHRSMPLTPARTVPLHRDRLDRTTSDTDGQAATVHAPSHSGVGQEASVAVTPLVTAKRIGPTTAARTAETAVSREMRQPQAIRLDVAARRTASPVVNETVIESLQQTIKSVEQELNQAKAQWNKPSIDMNRLADQMFKEFSQRLRHAQQRRGM